MQCTFSWHVSLQYSIRVHSHWASAFAIASVFASVTECVLSISKWLFTLIGANHQNNQSQTLTQTPSVNGPQQLLGKRERE